MLAGVLHLTRFGSLIVRCNSNDAADRPTSDVLEWELAQMLVWLFGLCPTRDSEPARRLNIRGLESK